MTTRNTNTTLPIPTDLLPLLAKKVNSVQVTYNLSKVNRACHAVLSDEFYRRDALNPGIPSLYRAIQYADCDIIANSIQAYRRVGATGMLDGSTVQWDTFDRAPGEWKLSRYTNPAILAVQSQRVPVLRNVVKYLTPAELNAPAMVKNTRSGWGLIKIGDILGYYPFPPKFIERFRESYFYDHPDCPCMDPGINVTTEYECRPMFSQGCGETALFLAVETLNTEMAGVLLKAGRSTRPPPVSSDGEHHWTAAEPSILTCLLGSGKPRDMIELGYDGRVNKTAFWYF